MRQTFDRFKHYSKQAARAERKQQWDKAAKAWEIAALNCGVENQRWCESRKAFCQRMIEKSF